MSTQIKPTQSVKDEKGNTVHMIEIDKLATPALRHLKKQLEQELGIFQDSNKALKLAQSKFLSTREALNSVEPEIAGSEILIPLTASIFVPGTVADVNKVLVDVGTGYLINMPIKDAKDYYDRKMTYLTEQIDRIQGLIVEKHRMRDVIIQTLEIRMAAQLKSGKPADSKLATEVAS